jgi:S1-C subfamily serine protease
VAWADQDSRKEGEQGSLGFGFHYQEEADESGKIQGWLYVHRIAPGSPAEKADLRLGDLITALDGKPFRFENDLELLDVLKTIRADKKILLTVQRGQRQLSLEITPAPMTTEMSLLWQRNYQMAKERAKRTPKNP